MAYTAVSLAAFAGTADVSPSYPLVTNHAAVVPVLEDALMDRDLVHRQTACAVVQHMSLGELAAAHCAPIVCPLAAHCVYARRPVERLGLLSARLRLACVAYCVWLAVVVEGCPAVGCLLIGTLHCIALQAWRGWGARMRSCTCSTTCSPTSSRCRRTSSRQALC